MKKQMNEEGRTFRFADYDVKVVSSRESVVRRKFGAKAVILPEDGEVVLVENEPRRHKSREVGRSIHSRMVRRPDGRYTLTFRFSSEESRLREQLVAEVRYHAGLAQKDHARVAKAAQEGGEG